MTRPPTDNVEGLIGQRRALTGYLHTLEPRDWDRTVDGERRTVKEVVTRLVAAYEAVREGNLDEVDGVATDDVDVTQLVDLPPELLLARFEEVAADVESRFAERADARWELSRDAFREGDGTMGMFLQQLVVDLHLQAYDIGEAVGRPVELPDEARTAAVAAVTWWLAGKVRPPVRLVLGDDEFMLGSGRPEATVETDHGTLLEVATGRRTVAEAEQAGRWRFDGTDDQRQALAESFRLSWGGDEIAVAGD